jgi:hypothetical protein
VLSSQDSRTLAILSNPKLQYVRLARRIRFFEDPARGIERRLQAKEPNISEEVIEAELAVWWVPPKDIHQENHTKRLEGEIHLAKELPPSSDFIPFVIEVSWNSRLSTISNGLNSCSTLLRFFRSTHASSIALTQDTPQVIWSRRQMRFSHTQSPSQL